MGLSALMFVFMFASAHAQEHSIFGEGFSSLEITCARESDERVLTVVPEASGCVLYYRKFDRSAAVAESDYGTAQCDQVRRNIRGNLERAGFVCHNGG